MSEQTEQEYPEQSDIDFLQSDLHFAISEQEIDILQPDVIMGFGPDRALGLALWVQPPSAQRGPRTAHVSFRCLMREIEMPSGCKGRVQQCMCGMGGRSRETYSIPGIHRHAGLY